VPRPSLLALAAVALALAGCGASKSASTPTSTTQATTTQAAAKTPAATSSAGASVDAATNSKLGQTIAVDAQGDTLYVLSPETTSHLLCTSAACLTAWPPLTVSSSAATPTAGPGVNGHLGVLKRSNGTVQVTLNGMPLYRFAGDNSSGEANGEGLSSFGGTWYTVKASGGATSSTPATTESNSEY
jgi:predicted lipoprotein with Yx(FWY)xxD motif